MREVEVAIFEGHNEVGKLRRKFVKSFQTCQYCLTLLEIR